MSKSKRKVTHRSGDKRRAAKRNLQTMHGAVTASGFYLLKWIACVTFLIDSIALFFQTQCSMSADTFVTMRYIGRIAFPLFAYLLVEEFHSVKSRGKHLVKLGILALISEIPYDFINISRMPVEGNIINFEYQNMFVSLFLSFVLLMVTDTSYDKLKAVYNNSKFGKLTEVNLKIIFLGLAMGAAYLLHAEFLHCGVLLVFLLNFARSRKHKQIFQAFAFLIFGLTQAHIGYLMLVVPFALIVLTEYSAKIKGEKDGAVMKFIRGKFSRTVTGIFYPFSMIILIAVRMAMVW